MSLLLTIDARDVFSPVTSEGVARAASMGETQRWAIEIQTLIAAGAIASLAKFVTRAEALSDLSFPEGDYAIVLNDPNPKLNGYYRKVGGVGAGTWLQVSVAPSAAFITANNIGAGTANAPLATTVEYLSDSQLISVNFTATNTSPMTLKVNDDIARPLVTNTGGPMAAGYVTSNLLALAKRDGVNWRLYTDVVSATIVGNAEAAANRAEAAAGLVTGSVASIALLKSVDTTTVKSVFVSEIGREGRWSWRTGNYSAQITADGNNTAFVKANAIAATAGAWVRTTEQVSTPRTANQTTAGIDNISHNTIIGAMGYWDADGAGSGRPVWVAGVDNPKGNIGFYTLPLTGNYIHPSNDGSVIYGGRPSYFSAIDVGSSLSHVAGKDNYTEQISSTMFTDHSDLFLDAVNNQGGHGAIVGGSFHVGGGDNVAIYGGEQTQVWGDNAVMIGGKDSIIGDPARSTAEQAFTGVMGGFKHKISGQYNAVAGGLEHLITRQTSYSFIGGAWNVDMGDTSARSGMAVIGGRDHTILGVYSAIVGGQNNTVPASGEGAVAMGQRASAGMPYSLALASGRFANNGDSQVERAVWFGAGTGAVIPGAGGVGGDKKTMPVGAVCNFSMRIVGARTDVLGETYAYNIRGIAHNLVGTPSLVTQTLDVIYEADTSFSANAEFFGNVLGCRCTGQAGKTVRWTVDVELVTLMAN